MHVLIFVPGACFLPGFVQHSCGKVTGIGGNFGIEGRAR